MTLETNLFKVTTNDGSPIHGGKGRWGIPAGEAGRWRTVKGKLVPCKNGLHLCHIADLVIWLGPAIWIAEVDETDEVLTTRDAFLVRKARLRSRVVAWDERAARRYAADVAERTLPLLGTDDERPARVIAAARALADGESIDRWELAKLAGQTAAAQKDLGNSMGQAAALAAMVTVLEESAATAARNAARLAAESAAWDGRRASERAWQVGRLLEYMEGTA